MTPSPETTRFAPSPTGLLHLGHAYAAVVAWRRARDSGGRFLLRIEDIDRTRCRPEYEAAILEDMRWLGLDWDGPVRRQSDHFAEYAVVLDHLVARGLLYPCFCTRAEIAQSARPGPDGPVYPGTCAHLPDAVVAERIAAGFPHAWRLRMVRACEAVGPLDYGEEGVGRIACDPMAFGDIVLARKETPASYHLCVSYDDALQGVTLVTRGAELCVATDIHRVLQALMGWPEPRYAHHAVVVDAVGHKLSKSRGSPSLRDLRERGLTPAQVVDNASLIHPTSRGGGS